MKRILNYFLFFLFLVLTTQKLQAQNQEVTGTVINVDDKQPLSNVTIMVKGKSLGTSTDELGKYTIKVSNQNDVLIFSSTGYLTQSISLSGRSKIDVEMKLDIKSLGDVVVVGYGTQRKAEITSAITHIKSEDFVQGSVKDAGQLLQGKIAGLTIGSPSGDPDASSQILLRGMTTLFSSTQPLILIDGIPGGLNTVAPEDIQSVDVLKDGSAAAIYGTRGTNGVILITTRKPNGSMEPTINFSSQVSTESFMNLPDMLTSEQYRYRISKGASGFQDEGASIDWVKEITRSLPITHSQQITVRGGNPTTNYLATFAYRNRQGMIITSESRRINGRIDLNHNMLDNKLKFNINFISNDHLGSVDFDKTIFRSAIRYNPTVPILKDGENYSENFGPTENFNPVAMLKEQFGDKQSQSTRISGSALWSPLNDLRIKLLVSRNKFNSVNGYGQTKKHYSQTRNGFNGYASKDDYQSTDQLFEFTTEYSKILGLHKISGLAGYSYQENEYSNSGMSNYDFPVGNYSYIDNIGAGNALKQGQGSIYSRKEASNLIGFFGRLTYNYQEKYLLMASLRQEGASQFVGTKQPWGTFPSISAGWRLNEEEFMKGLSFVDNLKVRAGYGVTGTSPDELFLGVPRLGYSGSFLINGQWQPSIIPISNPNEHLRWEEKRETNIGLDYSILKGRISGSLDFYNRKTVGLLFDYQVPSPPNLFKTTKANVGQMQNKGLELLVNTIPVQKGKFTWNSGITFSTNKNKLLSLENDLYKTTNPFFDEGWTPTPIGDISHRIEVGQPIGNFWGYKVIDITETGFWVYENGEGKSSVEIPDPATDRKVIGNGLPKYYGGWNNSFRYGRFDLGITMRGAFGFQIINAQRMLHENPGFQSYNLLNSAYDKVFGKTELNTSANVEFNSYYVENGDYWKIDNITLGYDFNVSSVKHIKTAKLFVSTLNSFIFTGYKGMDPEVNQVGLTAGYDDRDKYPTTRVYSIGLNITFN